MLNFWCSDIWIILFHLHLGPFDEVALTFVVFRQSMGVAVRTVTTFTPNAQKSNLFLTTETF